MHDDVIKAKVGKYEDSQVSDYSKDYNADNKLPESWAIFTGWATHSYWEIDLMVMPNTNWEGNQPQMV